LNTTDPALRAVRAYLRAHPEANAGTEVEDGRILVGIARDHDEHSVALNRIAGDRVTVLVVPRPVRDLIVLQRRLEQELPEQGIEIRAMSAVPLRGVVRLELDAADFAAATAFLVDRYGDAVEVTTGD
jgi:hypothetical protein